MRLHRSASLALTLALVAGACSSSEPAHGTADVLQPAGSATTQPPANAAPEFPTGLDWLNVDRPLSLAELRGKVVLLDFWTYGCINCIHIIPDLKRLEAEYADELVVIGVHSAKFENEGDTDNIRNIIARYDIEHPVVNDKDFAVWQQWGARAWPTLVLIDPNGDIVGGHSGEGIYPIFQPVIDRIVEDFDDQGRIDRTPLELVLEKDAIPASVLSFPGKVLADSDRLYVADTANHRIVVADRLTGEVLDVAGLGSNGFDDGAFGEASFDQPQGMELSADGGTLWVADTGNHAIRALDLEGRTVTTFVGTGDQARTYPPTPGSGTEVELSTPWALELDGDTLYVAMAGSHQLWQVDVTTGDAAWFAGNGRETTLNGPRLSAELAQPSGLAVLPSGRVVFADSESSAIRYADPGDGGTTGLMAGSDANLFDFGDVDGAPNESRLQHPLGVEYAEGALWIADTYNSKIKRLDPKTFEIESFAGGSQGWADGDEASFSEPGGVSAFDGLLYVADTNNHAIRVIDLASGETTTLVLFGIERFPTAAGADVAAVDLGTIAVAEGPGAVSLDVVLPDGYKVNDLAPFSMEWVVNGPTLTDADRSIVAPVFPLVIDADLASGDVAVELTVYYCEETAQELCLIERVLLTATLDASEGGGTIATLRHEIVLPG
jgi:thiol-disulfide isomerase/thioredoxin/sugar lactone lactonase YvrE